MNFIQELSCTDYKNIFILLKKRSISQSELAAAIGVNHGTVSKWKSGIRKPGAENISKIAEYFNVSADYLLGRSTVEFPHGDLTEKYYELKRENQILKAKLNEQVSSPEHEKEKTTITTVTATSQKPQTLLNSEKTNRSLLGRMSEKKEVVKRR